jgi:LmbE family N-acetylglucosaminyl deacetylase
VINLRHPAHGVGVRLAATIGAFLILGAFWIAQGAMLSAATTPDGTTVTASAAAPSTCTGGAMQIVAHEDDDLLFQSPDLVGDIVAGRCVRTVFVTAGDAAKGETYWKGRETGSLAAYAQMAGVPDAWTTTDAGVPGHPLRLLTLTGAPQVSLVFMRLPDGNRTGSGMLVHDHESLMRLWQGAISSIGAVDGSTTYTQASLTSTLTALLTAYQPTTVRTQDWTIAFRHGDNADHTATALFVRQADRRYGSAHTLLAYGGYPMWTRLPNVTGEQLKAKKSAFLTYATHDSQMCLAPWCPGDLVSSLRLSRQYIVASESTGNVAREPGVTVSASSQDTASGQVATKAVDGFALGDPLARAKEWATEGGTVGSWIQLDLPAPANVNGVVLFDRPNTLDQITGATLVFSDGSSVATGPLANNGSAKTIGFPARRTTSIRLVVTSVSPSTRNVGLAEIEVYGNMPATQGPPATP